MALLYVLQKGFETEPGRPIVVLSGSLRFLDYKRLSTSLWNMPIEHHMMRLKVFKRTIKIVQMGFLGLSAL